GSIWLGYAGLKWLLELLGKLRNPQFNIQGFIQFFRDGYRTLEVSGIIDISEFHSGSQQGGIRVPDGRNGDGVNLGKKSDLGKGFDNGLPAVGIHRPKLRVQFLADAPRPMCSCDFIWKPCNKTLRITLSEGNLRQAKWAWINAPKQARMANTRAQDNEVEAPTQARIETARAQEPQVNEVAQRASKETWVPKQPQPSLGLVDQLEILSWPSPILIDQNKSEVDSVTVEDLIASEEDGLTAEEAIRDLVLHSSVSDVFGVEGVTSDAAMEFVVAGTAIAPPLLLDRVNGMEMASLLLLEGASGYGSPPLPLPWSTRPDSERTQSPIVCKPLAKIAPLGFSKFTDQYLGDVLALEEAMSLWVEQKYKDFGELVGMLIAGFEAECIALLCRIDAERKKGRHTLGPCKPTRSVKKGTRELRNLISTVNYGGKKVASLRH
ncbi:hypothetical protein FCV25MIE_00092, partial [Fagus crenata]